MENVSHFFVNLRSYESMLRIARTAYPGSFRSTKEASVRTYTPTETIHTALDLADNGR